MRRSWAAKALLLCPILAWGCGEGKPPASEARPSVRSSEILEGWMGRYGRRDEGLRVLLSSQEAWGCLRDMELSDAIELFQGGSGDSDRTGEARSYLELASFYEALDRLYLEVETRYLDSLGDGARLEEKVRNALGRLRLGDPSAAQALFGGDPPRKLAAAWEVGRAGVAVAEGRWGDAEVAARRAAETAKTTHEQALTQVACYGWGLALDPSGEEPYSRTVAALKRGDAAAARRASSSLELRRAPRGPGPDLYAYLLHRRVCGALAARAIGAPSSPDVALLAAQAREHLGEDAAAAELYRRATEKGATGGDAVWLFSPMTGAAEGTRLAAVLQQAASHRARQTRATGARPWVDGGQTGERGALVTAATALWQTRFGALTPFENTVAAAERALASVREEAEALPRTEEGNLLQSVFLARVTAVSRMAAEVIGRRGDRRGALETMERAHRKAAGYRPDFVNPPAFLVNLAGAYADAGEYASAAAVLFELSRRLPMARSAYESLKRLYAAKTGGNVQPRY